MFIMDVDNLIVLQRERYNDFVRQAELMRLLRLQKANSSSDQPAGTNGQGRLSLLTAFQQMIWTVLQTHVRAVRPH